MNTPSIAIWIDEATQHVKVDFTPQRLSPAEYGVVMASLLVHISRLFVETNPDHSEEQLIQEVLKGIRAGLDNRKDIIIPSKAH